MSTIIMLHCTYNRQPQHLPCECSHVVPRAHAHTPPDCFPTLHRLRYPTRLGNPTLHRNHASPQQVQSRSLTVGRPPMHRRCPNGRHTRYPRHPRGEFLLDLQRLASLQLNGLKLGYVCGYIVWLTFLYFCTGQMVWAPPDFLLINVYTLATIMNFIKF